MRILMLGSGSIHSSLTHRILRLGSQLASRGHDVTLMVPRADKYSRFQPDMPASIDGVRVLYPYQFTTTSPILNLIPYLASAIYHVLRQPTDLIYLYKPSPITIPGLLPRFLRRIPLILDMDDLGSEVMAIEHNPKFMVKLVQICEHLAAKSATKIVVASTFLEALYTQLQPAKPILRLSNGVNPSEFTPSPATATPNIIFFGALGRPSLIQPLIEAIPLLTQKYGHTAAQIHIYGDGSARPQLETLAATLGVTANITFHGWTKLTDFASQTHRGDIGICLMPSGRTTAACSNQKVFQYMALELCPVVSEVGDLPLYVEHGAAGRVVPANNPEALAITLHELLTNTTARQTLAHRGHQLATTTYAWSTLAARLDTFIQEETTK